MSCAASKLTHSGLRLPRETTHKKRHSVLSAVSSIYEPLRLISPFVLPAKVILQDLCRLMIGWGDRISEPQLMLWQKWVANFAVCCCVKPEDFGDVESAQLHHFADASNYGYGTATYLRLVGRNGNVHCTLMAGKSRVALVKPITIPRAEPTAATVSVRMNKMTKSELEIPIDDTVFWTDSVNVLKYIENETTRFHTFAANRINLIREGSAPSQWRYVDTTSNPGDDAEGGLSADALLDNKRWTNGPEFLWDPETEWPKCPEVRKSITEENDPEVKNEVAVNTVNTNQVENATNQMKAYFSDWLALKKYVAWFMRLCPILLGLAKNRKEIRRDIHEVGTDPIEQQETEKERTSELKVRENTDREALTIHEL